MNAPDTNLLVYAYNQASPFHSKAKAYWEDSLNGIDPVGIPVICIHGFIRVMTGPALRGDHHSLVEALEIVDVWLERPNIQILNPGPDHWRIPRAVAGRVNATSAFFTDAAIAAIAIEHGAIVHSYDRDFARFPGLRWLNPLES